MKGKRVIETPRGFITEFKGKNGKTVSKLTWNPGLGPQMSKNLNLAQAFVDNEVLRRSEKYTPFRSGTLRNSGTLGTVVGSGLVQWIAPYARAQYYSTRKAGSSTGSLRGPKWFERMKNDHKEQIISAAKKIGGGGK